MTTYLNMDLGYRVDRKRIKRLYRLMGLTTIYPNKNLSKQSFTEYKYPYLLKDLEINRSNQVCASDITYKNCRLECFKYNVCGPDGFREV